jgi:hypothetical protein
MNKIGNKIFYIFAFLFVLFIYRQWFLTPFISGGDWPHFYDEAVRQYPLFPEAWHHVYGGGFGGPILSYSLATYLYFTFFLTQISGLSWHFIAKFFWFLPFIILSFSSPFFLLKSVWDAKVIYKIIAGIIYSLNTYILMLVIGGQMGIALAYSLLPFALGVYIHLIREVRKNNNLESIKKAILATFGISLVAFFDLRIFYLFSIAALFYTVFIFFTLRKNEIRFFAYKFFIFCILICGISFLLLQAFWALPLLFVPAISHEELGVGKNIFESLRFFSFAKFSDSISFLHPNWPENIFGKTFFFRPEFLLIPLLAFLPLTLLRENLNSSLRFHIIFFSFLALVASFFAKGTNEPFADIYPWMFQNIPGFILFRDPTKWYVLIAIAYSILIPLSISLLAEYSKKWFLYNKKYLQLLFFLGFFIYSISLLRPLFIDHPRGTLVKREVPKEYVQLNTMLTNDTAFSRVLWVPKQQRFAMSTRNHPIIEAYPFFDAENDRQLIKSLKADNAEELLIRAGVKYIMIPNDSLKEIFVKDRRYNEENRLEIERQLDALPWLEKIGDGKISIYKTHEHNNLFHLDQQGEVKFFEQGNNYKVIVNTPTKNNTLKFSQNYSPLWSAKIKGEKENLYRTKENFIELSLKEPGEYVIDFEYEGEKYFTIGRYITSITFVFLILTYFMIRLIYPSKDLPSKRNAKNSLK